jgi:hypothetical protein
MAKKLKAKPATTIVEAMENPDLLGAALGDLSTWRTWLACLKAGYRLPLDADDVAAFGAVSGGRAPPAHRVRRFVAAASRRSAKSRIAAAKLVYEACLVDHSAHLAPGETGVNGCRCRTIAGCRAPNKCPRSYAASGLIFAHTRRIPTTTWGISR